MSPKGQCASRCITGDELEHSELKEHCITKLAKQQAQLTKKPPKVGEAGSASKARPSMLMTLSKMTAGEPLVVWKMRDPMLSVMLGKMPSQSKSENKC
jgi:hypothetical protein